MELVKAAVELIGAALHDDVHRATARVAISRIGLEGFDLHFRNGIHRRVVGYATIARHVRRAVKQQFIALRLAATHRETGGAAIVEGPRETRVAGRGNAIGKLGKRKRRSAVHRHVFDLRRRDHLPDAGRCG